MTIKKIYDAFINSFEEAMNNPHEDREEHMAGILELCVMAGTLYIKNTLENEINTTEQIPQKSKSTIPL